MSLVPIGQFSRMTRLSVKALRLYDENGLLPPAHVDSSTGYRYYDAAQANRAEIIRILRSIDMPLEQIRLVVDAKGPDEANRQLELHRERLTRRLANEERMHAYLESMIRNQEIHMPYEIQIETVDPQTIAAVRIRTNLGKISNDIATGFGTLMQGLQRGGAAQRNLPERPDSGLCDGTQDPRRVSDQRRILNGRIRGRSTPAPTPTATRIFPRRSESVCLRLRARCAKRSSGVCNRDFPISNCRPRSRNRVSSSARNHWSANRRPSVNSPD